MSKLNILNSYNQNYTIYKNFRDKIEVLLKELLLDNVNYHNITSRIKKEDSLKRKLSIKGDKYSNIEDITDIIGCRIITYFEDDIDTIVNILKKEFNIDKENSVNKKDNIESDQFGYLSYHIICSINKERLKLVEYKKYKNLKFEIQVRSILQHAWAEIEHDIGYKNKLEIPIHVRRKFSRIAGLLETADENFCDVKNSIFDYQEKIKNDDELFTADLNLDSLYLYTLDSTLVLNIDTAIATKSNCALYEEELTKDELSNDLTRLLYFNIKTIKELDKILQEKETMISKFSEVFLSQDDKGGNFSRGITYFYLTYLLILEQNNSQFTKNYINNIIRLSGLGSVNELLQRLETSYQQCNF